MSTVIKAQFSNYTDTVSKALDTLFGAEPQQKLPKDGLIILKPNLTTSSPPPVTTPVEIVEAVYLYLKDKTDAQIAIGEGCGYGSTPNIYKKLGYKKLADRYGLELFDFNDTETVTLKNPEAFSLKTFHMPKILSDAYLVSMPILKGHSFTRTTIAMKNLFGIAPGNFYNGSWNKSQLHLPSADLSVVDICRYKKPDLSIVDAVTGLTGSHLSGRPKEFNTILAGFDPVAVDTVGSAMLGEDPRTLPYLCKADGVIGNMRGIDLREIK